MKKNQTLETLTAMNNQQTQQFMAATLLAIAVTMKKAGLTELSISPNDYALLERGETLEPVPTVEGGMIYKFVKVTPPLAKRVVPETVANAVKGPEPEWFNGNTVNPAWVGWYQTRSKGKEEITSLYFNGTGWFKDILEEEKAVCPFRVCPLPGTKARIDANPIEKQKRRKVVAGKAVGK